MLYIVASLIRTVVLKKWQTELESIQFMGIDSKGLAEVYKQIINNLNKSTISHLSSRKHRDLLLENLEINSRLSTFAAPRSHFMC